MRKNFCHGFFIAVKRKEEIVMCRVSAMRAKKVCRAGANPPVKLLLFNIR